MSLFQALPADIQREVYYFLTMSEMYRCPTKILSKENDVLWKNKLFDMIDDIDDDYIKGLSYKKSFEKLHYSYRLRYPWNERLVDEFINDEFYLKNYINAMDACSFTLLDYVCHNLPQYAHYIEKLLSYDAISIEKESERGWNLLGIIIFSDYPNKEHVIELLLKAGAQINFVPLSPILCFQNPLICAIEEGNIEIVRLLLEYGADINCLKTEWGSSLAIDITQNKPEIYEILINHKS